MSFTVQELEHIANNVLNHHLDRGKILSQTIQEKPLLKAFEEKIKYFPAGKDSITGNVKGEYTTTIEGFSGDDSVSYGNPANVKQWNYPYKEIHAGIKFTMSELKKGGISVTETSNGRSTSQHSDREYEVLADLLDDKIEDMLEGRSRGLNNMFWRDGSQDSALVPGVRSFVLDDPTSATIVGGIDQSSNTWWRNRVSLLLSTTTPSNKVIIKKIQSEMRQLRRYSIGSPKHIFLAGSDFLDALEAELYASGTITQTGWAKQGSIDISMDEKSVRGTTIQYDPTLDDEGLAKYLYILDMKSIHPMYMQDERMKRHSPARPADKYVVYRAITDTLGLVCKQRNTSGVYSIN